MTIAAHTTRGILFSGDCLVLFANLRDGVIDTVFADPPFNLRKDYHGIKDDRSDDDYLDWCKTWIREAIRVLKPGGSLFIYNLPRWNIRLASYLVDQGMDFRHWIAISMKNGFTRPKHLHPAHYSLVYFTKGRPKTFNADAVRYPMPTCPSCGKPLADWGGYRKYLDPRGINLSDIWTDFSPVRHKNRKNRPVGVNELPPRIAERVILLTTNPGDIVLDPFGGGGTTYVVAESTNRLWIGSEIGDCYPITERLAKMPEVIMYPSKLPDQLVGVFRDAQMLSTLDATNSFSSASFTSDTSVLNGR